MLEAGKTYDEVQAAFRWRIPHRYNIAADIDRHADSGRTAVIGLDPQGTVRRYTFLDLKRASSRLANVLAAKGVGRGDRIGILLPQCPETAIAHLAAYRMGAVAVPLFTLFGEDALEYRLADSGAKAVVTSAVSLPKIEAIADRVPALAAVLTVGADDPATDFWNCLERARDDFATADTGPDDPVLLIYTSGTTGPPKGALHSQRVLLGHLPGVELPHDFFPQPGDLFWTPADWAWAGGLLDVLLPSLHHGVLVLAHRFSRFDPEEAFQLIATYAVRNTFIPPTALKMMRQVPNPRDRHRLALRSVGSGGESLGPDLLDWGRETLGVDINEFYGQTECNLVLSNCASIMPVRPGSMGRAVPGHQVEIVNEAGEVLAAGELGEVAVRRPDPVMFLQYWGNPEATQAKFAGDWLLTGDTAHKDEDGYFYFVGRDDDLITSAGYRIGPGEIEECLMRHPAVALAAAVGVPDPTRTEIVKAFIVLRDGVTPSTALEHEVRDFVRTRLAAHEYPRMVEFVPELPMTTTGKIRRKDLREREVQRLRTEAKNGRGA